jgi:hypothetical protein
MSEGVIVNRENHPAAVRSKYHSGPSNVTFIACATIILTVLIASIVLGVAADPDMSTFLFP